MRAGRPDQEWYDFRSEPTRQLASLFDAMLLALARPSAVHEASDLLAAVDAAARRERAATAALVALLVHVDSRRLYLAQGCSSLFTYCTQLSEHAAYGRIEAARAARRCPVIFRSGSARSLARLPTCD
jgi:hypothetical protein